MLGRSPKIFVSRYHSSWERYEGMISVNASYYVPSGQQFWVFVARSRCFPPQLQHICTGIRHHYFKREYKAAFYIECVAIGHLEKQLAS